MVRWTGLQCTRSRRWLKSSRSRGPRRWWPARQRPPERLFGDAYLQYALRAFTKSGLLVSARSQQSSLLKPPSLRPELYLYTAVPPSRPLRSPTTDLPPRRLAAASLSRSAPHHPGSVAQGRGPRRQTGGITTVDDVALFAIYSGAGQRGGLTLAGRSGFAGCATAVHPQSIWDARGPLIGRQCEEGDVELCGGK